MDPEWLSDSSGVRPRLAWSIKTEADILATAYARETGFTYVTDESGCIQAIDRKGEIAVVTRGYRDADLLAWADDGSSGVIITECEQITRLSPKLKSIWSATLPGEAISLAIGPYGNHVGVGLINRQNMILNWTNKRTTEFETMRPLYFLRFLTTEAQVIGAANQGLMCCHELNGEEVWREQITSNVGDVRITGDADTILLAGFNHGVQMYDDEGTHQGSYMVEGTPKLVDCTFVPENVAVTTVERHLYWLDADGEMRWAAELDEELVGLHCDALGGGLVIATQSGWVHRLEWLR